MKTPSNPGLRRTYINLKNANWDRYRQEVEDALRNRSLPTDCQRDKKIVRIVILKAASHHIHTGRHRLHEEPVPAEILDVMNRRVDPRKRDPTSPSLDVVAMYLSMVCGMFVCVSLSINVCMYTVSNAPLMSNATATVRVGGMGWPKPVATVLLMLCSAVFVECLVLNPCCVVMLGMFCVM